MKERRERGREGGKQGRIQAKQKKTDRERRNKRRRLAAIIISLIEEEPRLQEPCRRPRMATDSFCSWVRCIDTVVN